MQSKFEFSDPLLALLATLLTASLIPSSSSHLSDMVTMVISMKDMVIMVTMMMIRLIRVTKMIVHLNVSLLECLSWQVQAQLQADLR